MVYTVLLVFISICTHFYTYIVYFRNKFCIWQHVICSRWKAYTHVMEDRGIIFVVSATLSLGMRVLAWSWEHCLLRLFSSSLHASSSDISPLLSCPLDRLGHIWHAPCYKSVFNCAVSLSFRKQCIIFAFS